MLGTVVVTAHDEAQTMALAAALGQEWAVGDMVLLSGPLGAGKTTFVRGYLASIGHTGPVRSPTFNLVQLFETLPPVVHIDLYRVTSPQGLDLFELIEGRVAMIEWPDRLEGWIDPIRCWRVTLAIEGHQRRIEVLRPDEEGLTSSS
jgi:tRNA threonylcarbamoyladenosine biosynthesis protein TsaE